MGFLDVRGGKEYKLLFVTPSGREYMVTLVAAGNFDSSPPFVATEQEDGVIVAGEGTYSSLDQLAIEHGCFVALVESVEPTN